MGRNSSAATAKRERLSARVSPEQKAIFEHAAHLQGRTLTDFMVVALQEAANRAIRDHEVMTLSVRDSLAFAEAVLNPPEPNEALRKAGRRAREMFGA